MPNINGKYGRLSMLFCISFVPVANGTCCRKTLCKFTFDAGSDKGYGCASLALSNKNSGPNSFSEHHSNTMTTKNCRSPLLNPVFWLFFGHQIATPQNGLFFQNERQIAYLSTDNVNAAFACYISVSVSLMSLKYCHKAEGGCEIEVALALWRPNAGYRPGL